MAKPQITVIQGILEGETRQTDSGFLYNAFLGIPYAKPPVGDLRFKAPVPADSWEGVRDATAQSDICPQIDIFIKKCFVGIEDSLYLNVYVPENATPASKLPVMFWIHGGGYSSGSGSSSMYGPDYLVDKNVILVTVNYRLGALGFLCLHTAEVPGNAGLKDQVLALRWVKENIQFFGGNRDNITIFGESAGASSAHALTMTPLTRGMFNKAIYQSGSSISDWCAQSDPVGIAFKLAELLGFKTESKEELLAFLMTTPAEPLVMASQSTSLENGLEIQFSPILEQQFPQNIPFLTDHPKNIMLSGKFNKMPTMSGFTSNEGVLFLMKLAGIDLSTVTVDMLVPNFEMYIPKDIKKRLTVEQREATANKIKDFYFGNDKEILQNFFDLMSDIAFVKDTDLSVKQLTVFGTVPSETYYYRFSYSGGLNLMKSMMQVPYTGAAHGDELGYLFRPTAEELRREPTPLDSVIIQRITELWTNFAKYGKPTPKLTEDIKTAWKPVSLQEVNCYDINEECTLIQTPFQERIKFWESIENL